MRKSDRRGFTLIELLVVIAIIAILAAILLPVFSQAREKARQTTCNSNEKQIMTAVLMYQQDFDEKYPVTSFNPSDTNGVAAWATYPWGKVGLDPLCPNCQQGEVSWEQQVYPYIKSSQVFRCPDVAGALSDPATPGAGSNTDGINGRDDYTINRRLASGGWGNGGWIDWAKSDAQLQYPAQTIVIMENSACGTEGANTDDWGGWGWANSPGELINGNGNGAPGGEDWIYPRDANHGNHMDPCPSASGFVAPGRRHMDGSNYGFGDGHVKWFKGDAAYAQIYNDANDGNGVAKNQDGSVITIIPVAGDEGAGLNWG